MKAILSLLGVTLFSMACSHPIEIIGDGDVLSASGNRDCLLEDYQAGLDNCTENLVEEAYLETYYGTPRTGWFFHRWANYCGNAPGNECSFDIPISSVSAFSGITVPPLTAIFRPEVNTGFNMLLIGHSFFNPFALGMPFHAAQAGFPNHTQSRFFSGGGSGAPQAFWENNSQRTAIQAVLDGGDVEVFGMTYHFDYTTAEGYKNWIEYALAQNPDTRFFIALPWAPFPGNFPSSQYSVIWDAYHPGVSHVLIDGLRADYPGVDIYCIPYGGGAAALHSLQTSGNLPDVNALVSNSQDSVFNDSLGHADDILVDLGQLIWLSAIYDVDMSTYAYDPGYITDLKVIAKSIMDTHDPAYDAP